MSSSATAVTEPQVQIDLAMAIFHTTGAGAALAELDRVPDVRRDADYELARAQVLDALNKTDDAMRCVQAALGKAASRPDLYGDVANFLVKHQRTREAVQLMDEAARRFPDDRKILLQQAAVYVSSARGGDAEHALTQIENHWPEWAPAYVTYGILLEGQKRAPEAKSQLETALALGADGAEVYYYLAKATMVAAPEKLDEAEGEIEHAITLSAADARIQELAGRIAYEKRNYPSAVEHLEKAIQLRPDSAQTHFALANAYRALGRTADASRESERAAALREKDPQSDDSRTDSRAPQQ